MAAVISIFLALGNRNSMIASRNSEIKEQRTCIVYLHSCFIYARDMFNKCLKIVVGCNNLKKGK